MNTGTGMGPFDFLFFRYACYAAVLASIACGVIGPFVVATRMSSIAGGIAHASLGGVGLAFLLGINPLLGALLVGLVAAAFIARAYVKGDSGLDTLIAAIWAAGMSLGLVCISFTPGRKGDLSSYLFGSLLFVDKTELWLLFGCAAVLVLAVAVFYRSLIAALFDREFAHTRGIPTGWCWFLLLMLATLAVVSLIRVVGIVLSVALLAIPPVVVRGQASHLATVIVRCVVLDIVCTVSGLVLAYYLSQLLGIDLPVGALIVGIISLPYLAGRMVPRRV